MVLKKSNSRFHSGTTQRLSNRGLYQKGPQFVPSMSPSLEISLHGVPRLLNEHNRSVEHELALENIYDYLGISGPNPDEFRFNLIDRFFSIIQSSRGNSVSLNKGKMWLLSERIDSLMGEKNFLEGREGIASIEVGRVIGLVNRTRYEWNGDIDIHYLYKKTHRVIHPCPEESDAPKVDREKGSRSRRERVLEGKRQQNTRGLQRKWQLLRRQESEQEAFTERPAEKKVIVEFHERDHIDARCLERPKCTNCAKSRPKKKSLFKSKSWVNGKNSYTKGYTRLQIKEDEESCTHDSDLSWTTYDAEGEQQCNQGDGECRYLGLDVGFGFHSETMCQDFVVSAVENKRIKPKRKKSKCNDNIRDEEERINTACSQLTVRHPKGSFVVVDEDYFHRGIKPTGSEGISSGDDSGHGSCDKVKDISDDSDVSSDFIHLSIDEGEHVIETFEKSDTFVRVALQLDENVREMLTSSTSEVNSECENITVSGCPILVGNCYPPVLCVRLSSDNESHLGDSWNLVVVSSASNLLDDNGHMEWEITLKSNKVSNVNDLVKGQFFAQVSDECSELACWSLEELVKASTASIVSFRGVEKEENPAITNANNPPTDHTAFYEYGETRISQVFTVDEAVDKLDACNQQQHCPVVDACDTDTTQHMSSPIRTLVAKLSQADHIIGCDVCFNDCEMYGHGDKGAVILLPCQHTFCYPCWQMHVFHSLQKGAAAIKCMYTDCKYALNETVLNAFIPEKDWQTYYQRQRERRLDLDPRCQWCPSTKCDKLAVLEHSHSSSIQQFGCRVLCECEKKWCFGCKSTPHWPSSCRQNEVYKKILIRFGDFSIASKATFNIDLKPCPGCKYPIEKNEGCPYMQCRMCGTGFCWNCGQPASSHCVYRCKGDVLSTFVTYQLHNDYVNTFPLKFFTNSVDVRRRRNSLARVSLVIQKWLAGLHIVKPRSKLVRLPFQRSVEMGTPVETERNKAKTMQMVQDIAELAKKIYFFLEQFYILLSFAYVKKKSKTNKGGNMETYLKYVANLCGQLEFTASKLEDVVMADRHTNLLVKMEEDDMLYLSNGHRLLSQLTCHVRRLQQLSKDVSTEKYANLDPTKHFRYK